MDLEAEQLKEQLKTYPLGVYLTMPLPPFRRTSLKFENTIESELTNVPQDQGQLLLDVPSERKGTTKAWSTRILHGTTLYSRLRSPLIQDLLKTLVQAAVNSKELANAKGPELPSEHTVDFPRSETDIVVAFNMHVILGLRVMIRDTPGWLPNAKQGSFRHLASRFSPEGVNEMYRRNIADDLPGVRVDIVWTLRIEMDELRPRTREQTRRWIQPKNEDFERINSYNNFIRRDEIWGLSKDLQKVHTSDLTLLHKALLPIEIKRYGALVFDVFDWIARNKMDLGLEHLRSAVGKRLMTKDLKIKNSTQLLTSAAKIGMILGTISIIQQALRYSHYYASQYVIVTDYASAVLFKVTFDDDATEGLKATKLREKAGPSQTPRMKDVEWAFLEQENIRLITAAVLFKECRDIDTLIADLEGSGQRVLSMTETQK